MEKLNHPAILVVDMLNDFVTGALACDRGKAIVPATASLLKAAREKVWVSSTWISSSTV